MNGPLVEQVVPRKNKRKNKSNDNGVPGKRNANVSNANDEHTNNASKGIDRSNSANMQSAKSLAFHPPRQEHVYVEASPVSYLYEQLLRGTSGAAPASSTSSNQNRKQTNINRRRPFSLQHDFIKLPYPRGMVNNSNFCFMNSILQSLLFIPAFAQLTVSVSCDAEARECCPTLAVFGKWALQYWNPGYTRLSIVAPHLMPRNRAGGIAASGALSLSSQRPLDGSVQEDAQEFLQKLLECIQQELVSYEDKLARDSEVTSTAHSEINSVSEERNTNNTNTNLQKGWTFVKGKEKLAVREHVDVQGQSRLMSAIFGGTLESHLQGKQRHRDHVSVLVEKYFCVPVDIGFAAECTIEQALEHSFTTEEIYDTEREKNLKKTLRFGQLPSILLLQLRRWAMTCEGDLVKLDNVVHLKRTLQIPRSICGDETLSNAERSYQLLSVVCHRGGAVGRGHYVTYLVHHAASPDVVKVQATGKANEAEATRSAPPSASVILCNDSSICVVPAKSMEKETVYFLVYQKMS